MDRGSRFRRCVCLRGRQPILGLALEFRLADEYGDHAGCAVHYVVACDRRRALALTHSLGMVLDALQQRTAQPRLVRAAVRRRNRVAIGGQDPSLSAVQATAHCARAVHPDFAGAAGEDIGMDERRAVDRRGQIILKTIREMEGGLLRYVLDAAQKLLGAGPADLDTSEQIGLGARHLEHALRLEARLGPKDFRIGPETHFRAAPVGNAPSFSNLPFGLPRSNTIGAASARARPRPPCAPTAHWRPRRRHRAGRPRSHRPSESNFPPACKVHMITSSADFS